MGWSGLSEFWKNTLQSGGIAPQTKIKDFCALSQNYQNLKIILFEKQTSWSKLSEKFQNGIEIFSRVSGSWVIDKNKT